MELCFCSIQIALWLLCDWTLQCRFLIGGYRYMTSECVKLVRQLLRHSLTMLPNVCFCCERSHKMRLWGRCIPSIKWSSGPTTATNPALVGSKRRYAAPLLSARRERP